MISHNKRLQHKAALGFVNSFVKPFIEDSQWSFPHMLLAGTGVHSHLQTHVYQGKWYLHHWLGNSGCNSIHEKKQ